MNNTFIPTQWIESIRDLSLSLIPFLIVGVIAGHFLSKLDVDSDNFPIRGISIILLVLFTFFYLYSVLVGGIDWF